VVSGAVSKPVPEFFSNLVDSRPPVWHSTQWVTRMEREDWNARYAASELVWGAAPNRFVEAELRDLHLRGRALDLACGEGRNAIWLAKLGWSVTAVDYSEVALARGRRLAAEQGIEVDWIEADITTYVPPVATFQLVIIAYLHLPLPGLRAVLAHAAAALSPGGTLYMVGHARRNLTDGIGGPQQAAVLWEPAEIAREVEAVGLSVQRVEHVCRPVETQDGIKDAIDTVLRAERSRRPKS
jgi:SAM-dependent methyltransferase